MKKKSMSAFAIAAVLGLGAMHQAGAALVVDQQQTLQTVEGVALLPSWTSIGQSFTPGLDAIDWAEFRLRSETTTEVSVSLSILDGVVGDNGLGGSVLGTSSSVTVPFSEALQDILFTFATPVSLTPGGTYVLRLDLLSAGALKFGSTGQEYAGGRMFQSPYNAAQLLANEDFYFREGVTSVTSVSEPGGIALLGLGLAGMGLSRRFRSKSAA